MSKTFAVAQWEYLEKVRTKTFIISLIVTPLIILLFTAGPALLLSQEVNVTKPVGFIDTSGIYFQKFNDNLAEYQISENVPSYIIISLSGRKERFEQTIDDANRKVQSSILSGYILVLNGGTDSVDIKFRSTALFNPDEVNRFERAFYNVRLSSALSGKITSAELNKLTEEVKISTEIVGKEGRSSESEFMNTFFSSLILIMLLLTIIISIGGMLIRSILEEKFNRLIEILLSSCTPEQLLSGKILGLSALGLTQIIVWSSMGLLFTGTSLLPPDIINNIIPMLLFFVLGFLFYTSLYVGIGSIVTTEQEAQQVNGYLNILLFIPIIFALPAIQNPESMLVKVLSFIPFTSPSIMLFRLNIAPVPLKEMVVITTIMIISIMLTIMITSKIFKIGILSYGKRPSLKEIRRWLSES